MSFIATYLCSVQKMYKIFVQGIVQGVGFRPYIYRKAKEQTETAEARVQQ